MSSAYMSIFTHPPPALSGESFTTKENIKVLKMQLYLRPPSLHNTALPMFHRRLIVSNICVDTPIHNNLYISAFGSIVSKADNISKKSLQFITFIC